jgi:hypothetical protein
MKKISPITALIIFGLSCPEIVMSSPAQSNGISDNSVSQSQLEVSQESNTSDLSQGDSVQIDDQGWWGTQSKEKKCSTLT